MNLDQTQSIIVPEKYLPNHIFSTKDIYVYRQTLKQILLDNFPINYLADMPITAVDKGERFRTLDCLKVIKAILRNNPLDKNLDDQIILKLFFLFKNYIFHKNEETQACANNLLRFQCLDDESIKWLISNWEKSDHIQNRLLRYPKQNPIIFDWAKKIYQEGLLRERVSEVVGLLINDSVPYYVKENNDTLIWAIYYARVPNEVKERLLIERFSMEYLNSLWKVAVRLRSSLVIDYMRDRILQFEE